MALSAPTASEGKKTDLPKAPPPASVSGSADKDGAAPSMDFPEKWARSIGILGLLPKTKDGKIDPFLSLKLTGIAVLIGGLAMPVVVKVLTFYAAVKSFRSIQTPDPLDDTQWLTFWLVFSVVEFVFFGAHIVIMPFEALFDHWGGIGLILDGMKCVILICLGVFEGAQTIYPKLEPYLLKADAVATAKALKYQKWIMDEVDADGDGKITFDELKARLSGKQAAPSSQLAKAAPVVKTNAAKIVRSAPPGPSSKTQVVVKSGKEASTVLGSIVKTVGYLLETNAEIQMKAVIKIQALFRGVKDRKNVKALHARKVLMQGGLVCFLVAWVLLLLADCISFDLFAQGYAAVGVGVFAWFVARSYRKMTKKKKIKKINTGDATSQVAKEAPVVLKKNAAKVVRSAPPPAAVAGSAGKDGAAPSMDSPALPSLEKWARSIGIFGVLPKTNEGKIDPYLSLKLTGITVLIGGLAMPVVLKVLTFYAAVKSFRSIQTPDPEDDKQWLTFWLVFSLVELVFFGAHIVIMPFEALFDHWGGIGLILDGMKCIFLICLGVFEGAQTMYPKLEPYLLKADAVATAKALKYQKFMMVEVDANGKQEAPTSLAKAAAEVKTNEATSVNSMPPPVATPRPSKQPEFPNIAIKKDASWLREDPAQYKI